MGVPGGMSSILSFSPKRRYYDKYKNKRKYIVIDARNILCRLGIGILNRGEYIVNDKHQNVIEIYICLIVAYKFLAEGITPIFVFDGAASADDTDTLVKRQNRKHKAENNIEKIISSVFTQNVTDQRSETEMIHDINDQKKDSKRVENETENDNENDNDTMTKDEKEKIWETVENIVSKNLESSEDTQTQKGVNLTDYIKCLKQSFQLKSKNIEESKRLIRKLGGRVVDAPGKGDPQCAAIAHVYAKNVIGVLTGDFDLLMYLSTNIMVMPSLGANYLEEYSMSDTLQHMCDMLINVINTSTDQELKDKYKGRTIEFSHENLLDIGCMMGNDYCSGFKTKKCKNKDEDNRSRIEIILELYAKNDMSLQNVLENMKNTLSKEYIAKMKSAKDKFRNAPIYHPEKLELWLKKPKPDKIRKICSSFIDSESIEHIISVVENTYDKHMKEDNILDDNDEKFGSFLSYRRKYNMIRDRNNKGTKKLICNSKIWPEPLYSDPIKIPQNSVQNSVQKKCLRDR